MANRCKIWIGGGWSRSQNQISFYSADQIDVNQDNSVSDALTISDDGHELKLEKGHFVYSGPTDREYNGSIEKAAEYLWQRFIEPLRHDR